MSVRTQGDIVFLEGRCGAEDAEALLLALQERPELGVDASRLARLHLAVAQILLALRPAIHARPEDHVPARLIFDQL